MSVPESVRIRDVLSLRRRPVDVEPEHEYQEIGVRSFGRGIFHKPPVKGGELEKKRVFSVEPGDLVISNVFAWEGAVAVASSADAGKVGSHRFMTFVPVDNRISTAWASLFFHSELGLELLGRASPGSAGRNRTLAIARLEALEIPLPPFDEQLRTTRLLENACRVSESLSMLLLRSQTMATAVQSALASPAHLASTQRDAQGWASVELGDVMFPSAAQVAVDPSAEYRLAGVYSFGRGLIDRGRITGADTAYKTFTVLSEGDVVVSKLNGWEGAVAVVGSEFAGTCVSSEFPVFKVDRSRLLPEYFRGIARSQWFWDALDAATRGSMVRRRRINSSTAQPF